MNTTRSKRWNGKIEGLTTDFLKKVSEKMQDYGDRVQFDLGGSGPLPTYQVIDSGDRRMTFDGNKHLLQAKAEEFVSSSATRILTLDQIQTAISRGGFASNSTSSGRTAVRSSGVSRASPRAAAAKAKDAIDAEKYEYFKNNRSILPAEIGEHSEQISTLMRTGMSAEAAFAEVVKLHF